MQQSTSGATASGSQGWDWPSAALVLLLIQVAAARLVMTAWTPFLFYTQTVAAFGCAIGLALAQSRFGRRAVTWLAIGYTLAILPWVLSGAIESDAPLLEKLGALGERLWFSVGQFFARKPVDDVVLFVTFAALGFWLIALISAYSFARRRDYLTAVLPAAVVMLLIQAYDYFVPVRIWAIGLYVFLALLLLGRLYLLNNRLLWEKERVFVTAEARQDVMKSLVTISTISVLAAWSIPISLSTLQSASQSWNQFTRPFRDRFSHAVSALDSPYGTQASGDYYGASLSLTRTAPQGNEPVFTVMPEDQDLNVPPRYYWRGHIYNYYSNGKWSTTAARHAGYQPSAAPLLIPEPGIRRDEVVFVLTVRAPEQSLLYGPAEPVWINRPGNVLSANTSDQRLDVSAWQAQPLLSIGDEYEVHARISNPTVEQLRAAGTEYPDWVQSRYLQVPENIRSEVQALAEQVTAEQTTAYDRAQAITFYLRQEIEYSASLAVPPKGRDPVLWVLFNSKEGFCVYYASAEVMMLRSLGIPARMAVGFAEGEPRPDGSFNVRKLDAHAWPEVYFPGVGWVEFEPTGNQDPLRRPLGVTPTDTGSDPSALAPGLGLGEAEGGDLLREGRVDESGSSEPIPFSQTPAGRALWFGSLAAIAAAAFYFDRRYHWMGMLPDYLIESYGHGSGSAPRWLLRWSRWNHMSSIERSFQAMNLSLAWLGKPQPVHITPIGRAAALRKLLPAAAEHIGALLGEHQSSLYTVHAGDSARARAAAFGLLSRTLQARLRALVGYFLGTPLPPDSYS